MEDEIFQLFNAENLKFLLKSRQKKVLLDDFSRFLAAYFLNFPPFLGKHNGTRLPTLLEWSDFGDEDIDTNRYQRISRRKVAEKLPPEFSPKFVALLLCRLEHYLEAALYTDYFNDFRSGLIIRYLTDIKHRITLFDDYCEKCLVEKLLTAAELLVDEPTNLVMKKFVEPYIEASLQIDLVFGKDFLDQIEEQAIFNMEILCFSLPDIVDESVRVIIFSFFESN
uniref:Uncharacterized protein n=1 Tax=Acrobeloides nanus TaxID=290746 RepID=A0A914DZU6_9BILA